MQNMLALVYRTPSQKVSTFIDVKISVLLYDFVRRLWLGPNEKS